MVGIVFDTYPAFQGTESVRFEPEPSPGRPGDPELAPGSGLSHWAHQLIGEPDRYTKEPEREGAHMTISHHAIDAVHTGDASRHERGASLVEYALLVALIAVVCIASVTLLGNNSSNTLGGAGHAVGGQQCPPGWHLVDQNHDGVLVCQPG